ncbi:MAG: helix-turn-helix transcriptional regulator [Gammaproteobacteria bacterium]|nr:helix-turn-helix transcriptional regulator [Gammaproteobacteria bacterium]
MNADTQHANIAASLLADARVRAELSLREVARRAGTSHATLLAYEHGRKTPSIVTFLRVLDACGFAVDFDLSPRVRWQDGIGRGEELAQVLTLAAQFPAKVPRRMGYPVFGSAPGSTPGSDSG